MNWKEFFKPTKGKMLIVLVVVLLWPNYTHEYEMCIDFVEYNEETAAMAGCNKGSYEVFLSLLLILNIFNLGKIVSINNFINFVASLIVSYLIASAIIFIWQKYKTKK